MEYTGTLRDLYRDMDGRVVVSFRLEEGSGKISELKDRKLRLSVKEYRKKRTMTQNAYYWQLLSQLAGKMKISTARLHNILLRDCAPVQIMDGKVVMMPIPDTDKAEEEALESSIFHIKPTSGIIQGKDGAVYRWYVVLRGSSTFNTQEMGALLDSLIAECREQGIETLPPYEIEKMRQWEASHGKERKSEGREG